MRTTKKIFAAVLLAAVFLGGASMHGHSRISADTPWGGGNVTANDTPWGGG